MNTLTKGQPFFKSVLLIDDDYITNIYNQKILEIASFAENIVAHKSASAALEYLNQNAGNLPDVIFLDIRMPDMDGFEFLEAYDKMKESFKKSPLIVMLSSTLNDNDRERSLANTSVVCQFEKPLNESKLKEIINIMKGGPSEG